METGRGGLDSSDTPRPVVIDRQVVTTLLDEFGPERTQEICDVFLADAAVKVDALQSAVDADDPTAASQAAHGLKSGSGFVGATAVYELCAEVERTARDRQLGFARTHMAELRATLAVAASELGQLVGPAPDPA